MEKSSHEISLETDEKDKEISEAIRDVEKTNIEETTLEKLMSIPDKSSDDWSNIVAELDKEISKAIKALEIVKEEILNLRQERIERDRNLTRAKYNVESLKVQRSLAMHNLFHCKNQGL